MAELVVNNVVAPHVLPHGITYKCYSPHIVHSSIYGSKNVCGHIRKICLEFKLIMTVYTMLNSPLRV